MVRALLGLPERAAGRMQGHGPLPPGAFRYQQRSSLPAPSPPPPWSAQEDALPAMDREEEVPAARAEVEDSQADRPAAGLAQPLPQPPARSGSEPLAAPGAALAHGPGKEQAPAPLMPEQAAARSAARGPEAPRQPAPDSRPAPAGEMKAEPAGREEIAIPGRSTLRQVFSALAASPEGEHLSAADQPPGMAQPAASPPGGQDRPASAAMDHGVRPRPEQPRPAAGQPPADRQPQWRSRLLPAAVQAEGLVPQGFTTAGMTAAQPQNSALGQRAKPPQRPTDKSAGRPGRAESPAAAPQAKADPNPAQRQEHPPGAAEPRDQRRLASATPARRPDEDGGRQIEELRRTFFELVSKKTSAHEPKDREQTTTAEAETPAPPPLQQIVVINRTSGSRSRGRLPAAFWERSYMARATLKMIR
ncbi:MAG: hypothetical protein M0P70_15140 [Desulfobulbaceae bacterium]|nr:hypothetical protein [Desulfobulbaceae bacterium]